MDQILHKSLRTLFLIPADILIVLSASSTEIGTYLLAESLVAFQMLPRK